MPGATDELIPASLTTTQDGSTMHGQPRPYRYLSDMPDKARIALERCHTEHVYIGEHAQHKIKTVTINTLTRRALIVESRDKRSKRIWRPSPTGLDLLLREEPRMLAARVHKGYTTNPALAAVGEPEAVDEVTVELYAVANNERHRALKAGLDEAVLTQQRSLEQRLQFLKRMAYERGIDTRSELRLVERGLDAIERKIRDQRSAA